MGQYTKISLILVGLITILVILLLVKENTSKQYYGLDILFFIISLVVIALLTVSCIVFSLLALFREKNLIVLIPLIISLLPVFFVGIEFVKSSLMSNSFSSKTQEEIPPSEEELLKSLCCSTGFKAICVLKNTRRHTAYLLEVKEIIQPEADEEETLLTVISDVCDIFFSTEPYTRILTRTRFIRNEQGGYDVENTVLQSYIFASGYLPTETTPEDTLPTIIKDADKEEYYRNLFDYVTRNSENH